MESKLVGVIIGATFVLGAGSAPSPRAAALPEQPTDACALLTQAQVREVLGVSVGAGQHILQKSTAMCGWEVPGDKSMGRKRVVLDVYQQIGSLTPVQRFNTAKMPIATKGVTKEPVSGVGDDAVSVSASGFGTGLIVKKGDSVFDVRVYGFPADQIKAKEKTLALDIIAKL